MSDTERAWIELEETDGSVVGGRVLRGAVCAPGNEAAAAEVELKWHKRSAQQDARSHAAVRETIDDAEAYGDQVRFPFAIDVPYGPYSHDDGAGQIEWQLEAVVVDDHGDRREAAMPVEIVQRDDIWDAARPERDSYSPGAANLPGFLQGIFSAMGQPTSRQEVRRMLGQIERGTGPYERENSFLGKLPMSGGFLLLGLALLIGPRLAEDFNQTGMWIMNGVGLVFACVGAWFLFKSTRNFFAERSLGDVRVNAWPEELIPGEALTFTVGFSPNRDVTLNSVEAHLKCLEIETTQGRKRRHRRRHHHHDRDEDSNQMARRTYRRTLYSEPVEVIAATTLQPTDSVHLLETFEIPEDAANSYLWRAPWWLRLLPFRGMTLRREIKWVVEVHVDIKNSPDWLTQYQVVVYP